jgi:hypothetical protein
MQTDVIDRVRRRTPRRLNERIDAKSDARVKAAAAEGGEALRRRLATVNREWDVDRVLMLAVAVAGTVAHELALRLAGRRGRRRWLDRMLRGQLGFLGIYALTGWAPPVPLLRLLGVRTRLEIERERDTLRRLGAY